MKKSMFVLLLAGLVLGLVQCSSEKPQSSVPAVAVSPEEAERWAASTLQGLTLREKVAQMVCEQIRGEYIPADDARLQYWMRLVREYGIGGFVLYGGTPHDAANLLNRLQTESRLPLLISADFEGGPGQQIAGATEFPGNMALSAIGSEQLAYEVGRVGAVEGRAIGIHLTYSPVVDIQTNPANPGLSVRSFGADLDLLGRLSAAYIRGYQDNGMLATAKHYPGRGEVELIPGTEFTINRKPADQVEREDLLAFKKAIDAGVAFIMSEHIAVPSLTDGSDFPASVEKKLATTWLREKLGFKGILTSDDLWYAKVTDRFGAERAGVLAIQAGHDALLKPTNAIGMIEAVAAAVKAGEISESRIDDSARKLLACKARLNLHRQRLVDPDRLSAVVGSASHRELLRRIADESLTLLVNRGFLPERAGKLGKVLHISIQKNDNDPAPPAVLTKMRGAFAVATSLQLGPNSDLQLYAQALRSAAEVDTVMVSLFNQRTVYKDNGPLRERDQKLIQDLVRLKPAATVVMSYGNPYLAESAKEATVVAIGYGEGGFYGNQLIYADALIRLLNGEIKSKGKLPVRVSSQFPIGSGIQY